MLSRAALLRFLVGLWRDRVAGVTTLATLALPVVLGSVGLAFDLNRGFEQRVINQRAADMSALGAAMAFQSAEDAAVLSPTARDIAIANGLAGATVEASLVADFPEPGEQAIRVRITRPVPFMLARVLGFTGSFDVTAESFASLGGGEPSVAPCFLALSASDSAIMVSGGASIDAPTCAVAAVGSVRNNGTLIRGHDIVSGSGNITLDWGALEAETLRFAGDFYKPSWNGQAPPLDRQIDRETKITDPWASSPELTAARTLLGTHTAAPTLSNPPTPGGANWAFDGSTTGAVAGWRNSVTGEYVVPAGNYDVGKLTIGGGIRVTFQSGSRITVRDGVDMAGSAARFGDVDLYVNGGFNTGSSGVTIGKGLLWIGSGPTFFAGPNIKGDGDVVINGTITLGGGQELTMGAGNHHFGAIVMSGGARAKLGAGAFTAAGGISIEGDSEFAIGAGDIRIGRRADGNAIMLGGSARFFMGDGPFSANGHIDTQGGSRLIFGKTANHLINGNMNIRGAVLFGAGRYTINGDFVNGTGGTRWPYYSSWTGQTYGEAIEGQSSSNFDMVGFDVTFILTGTLNLAGGARTKLEAPVRSITGGQISELLFASETSSAAQWGGGSVNAFGGTIYLPRAAVSMTGGNVTASGAKCMTLVADTILLSGGAATGTPCDRMSAALNTGAGGRVRLVR